VLSVHAGWDGERSRGSSALEDWADVVATLARDPDDDTVRYLRAFGRDVEVDEDRLVFEPDTRTLTLAGAGSRKRSKAERAIEAALPNVLDYVTDNPGCSGQQIRDGVGGNARVVDQARRRLVDNGDLDEKPRTGRGGGKCYRTVDKSDIAGTSSNPVQPRPDEVGTPSTPSYRGRGSIHEVEDEPRPDSLSLDEPDPWGSWPAGSAGAEVNP